MSNTNNSAEFLRKKTSSIIKKTTTELDIILDLITNILNKEDGEKCICSNTIPIIDDKNAFYEREIVPNLEVFHNTEGKVRLSDVITSLKVCGYPLTGAMVSIYFKDIEEFVFIGSDPIDNNILLDETQINNKIVKLKMICHMEEKLISPPLEKSVSNTNFRLSRNNSKIDKKAKRTKERKIGYIIEKVNTWRKLYNGFRDEFNKFTKFSLDEAAKQIGISKKSLDDYLLQLRLGRKFGFDFNANKISKVGVLRSFVKKHRVTKAE